MKKNLIYLICLILLALAVIYGVSQTNSNPPANEEVKKEATPTAYINKDKSIAIYLQGRSEPVLRIEDLPREFPPHIRHPEGARFPDTQFDLVSLSPDGQRIAFSCGLGHTWLGLFELTIRKLDVITWLFDTSIDQILWSPNSKYFTYTYWAPSGEYDVVIVGLREKTAEPYITNDWSSGIDNPVMISGLRWSNDGESVQFETQKYEIKELKRVKMENEPVNTVTLKVNKEEAVKKTPKKVKK